MASALRYKYKLLSIGLSGFIVAMNTAPCVATITSSSSVMKSCDTSQENRLSCPMSLGAKDYVIRADKHQYIKLTNPFSFAVQIDKIDPMGSLPVEDFVEYCVFMGEFKTGQAVAGRGESGCAAAEQGKTLEALTWRDSAKTRGLLIPPGQSAFIGINPYRQAHYRIAVDTSVAKNAVEIWRQPRNDTSILCDGEVQSTEWSPWQNVTQHSIVIRSLSIYSISGSAVPGVRSACIYLLYSNNVVREKYCNSLNVAQSNIWIAPLRVGPLEYVAAQATNKCKSGNRWDWAAYIEISK